MKEEKPTSWLDTDGELPFDAPDSSDGISRMRRLLPVTSIFVALVAVGTLCLGSIAVYLDYSSRTPSPTLMPVTPAVQLPVEYLNARYGVRVEYDHSTPFTGSCPERYVYGTVQGTEALRLRAQVDDTILEEQPVPRDRRFALVVPEQTASRFDVWLVDASGERITGVTDINLPQSSAPTCAIEVTFNQVDEDEQ